MLNKIGEEDSDEIAINSNFKRKHGIRTITCGINGLYQIDKNTESLANPIKICKEVCSGKIFNMKVVKKDDLEKYPELLK